MKNQTTLSETDKIFATGVFLQPVKCTVGKREQWRWVAVGFEDDSYYNGKVIDIYDYADSVKDLIDDSND